MQRYANLPVKVFIETQLRPHSQDELALNNLSCQYLWSMTTSASDSAAESAIELMLTIYNWGHYPTRLIAFICSWKHKAGLDEVQSTPLLESSADMLVHLLTENPHPSARRLYLKLLGLIRLNSIREANKLQNLVCAAINSIGIHIQLDKLVLLWLIKCTLKISDKIRDYKYMIGQQCARLIFALFSSEYLQKAPLKEMAKLYMDYLKLLVALGREIAVCSSQGANKASKVQDSFYMDSLFKVMVSNLSLRLEDAVFSNWLDYSDGCISQLVLDQRFKVLASFRDRIRMPGLPQYGRLDPIYPDLEEYPEDHSQGFSDYELLEKIKTNSLALIMVIVRAEPTLVLSKHLFPAVFPENLLKLNFGTMFGSEHFFPANIYCREMSDTLNRVYGSSGIMIHFASYVSIAKLRSRSAKESLRKWNNELASCLAEPVPQNSGWSTQMSLIGFFMTETNYKVKGSLINTIGVIHHQVYGICDIQDKCAPGSKYLISSFVNISREKLETFAVGFLMAYFLDLYTCPITNMRHIFEGIHQCPIQSMLVHIPNKFVERVIHFLVVPVLAVCLHLHFDFYDQFDKFLTTIFEARFSEFFLARINCLRELLVHNFSLSRATRQSCEEYATKVKVLISAADELMEKFPHHMKREYRLFGEFALSEVLADKQLMSVHYFAPLVLWRLCSIRKEVSQELSTMNIYRSICLEDLELRSVTKNRLRRLQMNDLEDVPQLEGQQVDLDEVVASWKFVEKMYVIILNAAKEQGFKDRYEKCLVHAMTFVSPSLFVIMQKRAKVLGYSSNLESLLLHFFMKIRSKKHQLMLTEHFLSSPFMKAQKLQTYMWEQLFAMQNERIFSVELVRTKYMVLQGLRVASDQVSPQKVIEIFRFSVGCLKSKNRDLVNTCLKIFGCILSSYPANLKKSILGMEVPNILDDSDEDSKLPITGLQFLILAVQKYLSHKYSKYNFLTLNCLSSVVKKIESDVLQDKTNQVLISKLLIPIIPNVIEKWCKEETHRYSARIVCILSKEFILTNLTEGQQSSVLIDCWSKVLAEPPLPGFTLEEVREWRETQYNCLQFFLKLHSFQAQQFVSSVALLYQELLSNFCPNLLNFLERAEEFLRTANKYDCSPRQGSIFCKQHQLHYVWISASVDDCTLLREFLAGLWGHVETLQQTPPTAVQLVAKIQAIFDHLDRISANDPTMLS